MFNKGLIVEEIAEYTNLDKEEISYYLSIGNQELVN